MSGERVPQRMDRCLLRDDRPFLCGPHHAADAAFGDRRAWCRSREEPGGGSIRLEIPGERAKGLFRENRVPVFLALTLPDEYRHTRGIDVTYLEVGHLADAEP